MKGSTETLVSELLIPRMLFAKTRRYLSVTEHKTIIDISFNAVERSRVFFLPILSQSAPPGNRDTAEAIKLEEMTNPRKAAENPSCNMYKLKITEKIPILTVVRAWLNKKALEFFEKDFSLSM
jgi:hypothetical protein